jgi:phosphonate transport system permease protein
VSAATASLPLRDPAARGRLGALVAAIVVLWPLLVLAEFRPAALFEAGHLQVMAISCAASCRPRPRPTSSPPRPRDARDAGDRHRRHRARVRDRRAARGAREPGAGGLADRPGPGRRRGALLRPATRAVLTVLRAIPEVVWALVFVRALGLGPGAGVLALAVTYGGMLGKVYTEILESGDTRSARALLEAGSGRLGALFYALVPSTAQELASYTVYRWECAVRASVVMGFVGAGGLGQLMDQSMKMLNGGEASTILLTFLLLVVLADAASAVDPQGARMSTGARRRRPRLRPVLGLLRARVRAARRGGLELRVPRGRLAPALQRRVDAPDGEVRSASSSRPTSPPPSSPRPRGAPCRPSPSPRSAPCSPPCARACSRCPRRAASASRRGSRRGSRSTCCAACPSWCGRR